MSMEPNNDRVIAEDKAESTDRRHFLMAAGTAVAAALPVDLVIALATAQVVAAVPAV